METFLTQIPNSFASWIGALVIVAGGITYFFKTVRAKDLEELRKFNKDLLDRTDFLQGKVENLEKNNKELNSKVEALQEHNRTLADLVVTALKQYFFENPDVAKNMQALIKK